MGERIRLTAADGHAGMGYRAAPEGKARGGVVVIGEVWGVNSWVREVVDRFARHGYLTVAPNLFDRLNKNPRVLITEPLGYFEFLKIISLASLVITDSGGVQEETSFLNVPCVTFRKNTERPVTIKMGTNILMDIWDADFLQKINLHKRKLLKGSRKPIPFWDEEVSSRICAFLETHIA